MECHKGFERCSISLKNGWLEDYFTFVKVTIQRGELLNFRWAWISSWLITMVIVSPPKDRVVLYPFQMAMGPWSFGAPINGLINLGT